MDSNILREYLVLLGFKVDDQSGKKAEKSVEKFDAQVKTLTKGVIGVGTAVTTMVNLFAFQMEKLYYASKKSDTTVSNLQAMDYGFRQIGGSAGGMTQAIANMASAMRSNPGLQGLLNSLGVATAGRDKADVMADLVTQLKKMPIFVAEKYANLFGIDKDTLYTLMQGLDAYKQLADQRKQMAADAGLDMEKSSEAATAYAQSLRELWERMGLVKDVAATEMLPAFTKVVATLNDLLSVTTQVDDSMTSLASDVGDAASTAIRGAAAIWSAFTLEVKLAGMQLGAYAAATVRLMTGDLKGAATIMKEYQADFNAAMDKAATKQERILNGPGAGGTPTSASQAGLGGQEAVMGAGNRGTPSGTRGVRNNNPGNLNFVGQAGATLESNGSNSRFAKFQTMEAGIGALAQQLQRYSSRGINTLDKIVAKYAPASENNTEAYVQALMKQTGLGRNQAIDMSNPAVMQSLVKGIISHENGGMRGITDDQVSQGVRLGAGSGGGRGMINQTNNITVTGVGDANKAAKEVAEVQRMTNADLVRQFTPRVQ